MNLIKNTDLLNHLASNYALGTLRGGPRPCRRPDLADPPGQYERAAAAKRA
jgi:hypothetical protein